MSLIRMHHDYSQITGGFMGSKFQNRFEKLNDSFKILHSYIDRMYLKDVLCSMHRLKYEVVVHDRYVFFQVMPPKIGVSISKFLHTKKNEKQQNIKIWIDDNGSEFRIPHSNKK